MQQEPTETGGFATPGPSGPAPGQPQQPKQQFHTPRSPPGGATCGPGDDCDNRSCKSGGMMDWFFSLFSCGRDEEDEVSHEKPRGAKAVDVKKMVENEVTMVMRTNGLPAARTGQIKYAVITYMAQRNGYAGSINARSEDTQKKKAMRKVHTYMINRYTCTRCKCAWCE